MRNVVPNNCRDVQTSPLAPQPYPHPLSALTQPSSHSYPLPRSPSSIASAELAPHPAPLPHAPETPAETRVPALPADSAAQLCVSPNSPRPGKVTTANYPFKPSRHGPSSPEARRNLLVIGYILSPRPHLPSPFRRVTSSPLAHSTEIATSSRPGLAARTPPARPRRLPALPPPRARPPSLPPITLGAPAPPRPSGHLCGPRGTRPPPLPSPPRARSPPPGRAARAGARPRGAALPAPRALPRTPPAEVGPGGAARTGIYLRAADARQTAPHWRALPRTDPARPPPPPPPAPTSAPAPRLRLPPCAPAAPSRARAARTRLRRARPPAPRRARPPARAPAPLSTRPRLPPRWSGHCSPRSSRPLVAARPPAAPGRCRGLGPGSTGRAGGPPTSGSSLRGARGEHGARHGARAAAAEVLQPRPGSLARPRRPAPLCRAGQTWPRPSSPTFPPAR